MHSGDAKVAAVGRKWYRGKCKFLSQGMALSQ